MRQDRISGASNGEEQENGLLPIPLATLDVSRLPNVDLFLVPPGGNQPIRYRQRNAPFTIEDVQQLVSMGVYTLFAETSDSVACQNLLRENLKSYITSSFVDGKAGEQAHPRKVIELAIRQLLSPSDRNSVAAILDDPGALASELADVVQNCPVVSEELFYALHHSHRLFTHLVNVGAICLLLAKNMGETDRGSLAAVAVGGMMHDIGKLDLPDYFLDSLDALAEPDRELLERHPQFGFERLSRYKDFGREQLLMVYQHHERPDGRGYPVRLTRQDIHPWSAICSVANAFDNLVGSVGPPRDMYVVVEQMDQLSGTGLDSEAVRCWRKTLAPKLSTAP